MLQKDIETYVKGYNVCLVLKAISYNLILVIVVELNYVFYVLSYSYTLGRACVLEEKQQL